MVLFVDNDERFKKIIDTGDYTAYTVKNADAECLVLNNAGNLSIVMSGEYFVRLYMPSTKKSFAVHDKETLGQLGSFVKNAGDIECSIDANTESSDQGSDEFDEISAKDFLNYLYSSYVKAEQLLSKIRKIIMLSRIKEV